MWLAYLFFLVVVFVVVSMPLGVMMLGIGLRWHLVQRGWVHVTQA